MDRDDDAAGLSPGVLITVLLGASCWALSFLHPALDSLVTGLIAGMLLGAVLRDRRDCTRGSGSAARFFIPLGIAAYGANLQFPLLPTLPPIAWLQLSVGMIVAFTAAILLGRALGLRDKASLLIGVGTAVCGATAIAMATPAIGAEKEDASLALPSIAACGLAGTLLYPALRESIPLTETGYALLTGTTLQMTGWVRLAAGAGGAECLALAMAVKMARVAAILLIVPLMAFAVRGRSTRGGRLGMDWRLRLSMSAFLVFGLLFSYVPLFVAWRGTVAPYASLFFTIALTSIGLACDVRAVTPQLWRGLLAASGAWAGCIATFAAGDLLIGY